MGRPSDKQTCQLKPGDNYLNMSAHSVPTACPATVLNWCLLLLAFREAICLFLQQTNSLGLCQ